MGKVSLFTINVHNKRQTIYPGEQLTGYVTIVLKEPIEVKSIHLKFEGKSYCNWSEGQAERYKNYTGNERIFEFIALLCGTLHNSDSRIILPAGEQRHPFAIAVPQNIPTSFEGSKGYIRYELEAKIEIPWKVDHKAKRPATVIETIDTNFPQFNIKPGGQIHKELGCMFCASGAVEMSTHIDRGAYCPGEQILITADVQNNSSRDMTALKANLIQTISYHATKKTKHVSNKVAILQGLRIPKYESAKWRNQALDIPELPPSIMTSRVVNVAYHVEVKVYCWDFETTIKIPIIMGTIPYRPVQQQQPQSAAANSTPLPPTMMDGVSLSTGSFGYPYMATPTYTSVMNGEQGPITEHPGDYLLSQSRPPGAYPLSQSGLPPGYYPPPTAQQSAPYPPPGEPELSVPEPTNTTSV